MIGDQRFGMRTRRIFHILALLAIALGWSGPGLTADHVERVTAVVNDDVISAHDLDMRSRMAMLSSNLPDTEEVRGRVVGPVLRKLIDEQLQLQEAKRQQITVSDQEIEQGIATIEQQNRMPPGSLTKTLAANGIDPATSRRQVEAEIAWIKLVRRVLAPTIRIGEEEIDDRLDLIKANFGQPEYLLAEIFLAVDNPQGEAETRKLAERMLEQLKGGVPFPALARQFSQSPTAALGGDLGWVAENLLEKEVAAVVGGMQPGQAAMPIRSPTGYHIVLLRDQRVAGQVGDPKDVVLDLGQLFFAVPETAVAAERKATLAKAAQIAREVTSCADLDKLVSELKAPQSGRVNDMRASDLPVKLRTILLAQKVGQAAPPMESADGVRIIMVCDREGAAAAGSLPNREQIRRELEDHRLDIAARRYLRDLRRAAFVDVRV